MNTALQCSSLIPYIFLFSSLLFGMGVDFGCIWFGLVWFEWLSRLDLFQVRGGWSVGCSCLRLLLLVAVGEPSAVSVLEREGWSVRLFEWFVIFPCRVLWGLSVSLYFLLFSFVCRDYKSLIRRIRTLSSKVLVFVLLLFTFTFLLI